MKHGRTVPLCCAALLWAGCAVAIDLQVAISRQGQAPLAARTTLLADFNLALAREICRRIGAQCFFSNPPFPEILPGIESRRFQLGFGNYLRTPEREARVAFSDGLWRSSSRLLARASVAARFATTAQVIRLETLRDARIVAISGSEQHRHLHRIAGRQGLQVLGVTAMADCLDALSRGEADFALLPSLSAYLLLDPTAGDAPDFTGPGIVDHGLGGRVHIALPRGDEELRRRVNGALGEMQRDGSYQRIWRRHFPFDLQ